MTLRDKLFAELEEIKRDTKGDFSEEYMLPVAQALGVRVEAIKTQLELIQMADDLEVLDEDQSK